MEKSQIKIDDFIKSGEFYKSVVEDGTDIVFLVDYSGEIKYHNPSVEITLGHKPNSLIGKNFFDFIHIEGREKFINDFNDCICDIIEIVFDFYKTNLFPTINFL